jgi:hypothetical protein
VFGQSASALPRPARQAYLDLAKAAYQAGLESCPAAFTNGGDQPANVDAGYAPPDGRYLVRPIAAGLYGSRTDESVGREAALVLAGTHLYKAGSRTELLQAAAEYAEGLPT